MNNKYAVKIIGGTGDIGAICYKGFDFNGTWFDNKEEAEEFKGMLEYINKSAIYAIIEEGGNMSNLEYAVQVVTSDDGTDGNICVREGTEEEFWTDSLDEVSKFKLETEDYHGKWATYRVISREKQNTAKPAKQPDKHRHPHADMIIEWAKDTSKVVECYDGYTWNVCDNPAWVKSLKYRFQPPKPERVFPTTSIASEQLKEIFMGDKKTIDEAYITVANAAIKQYILDTEKADDKT